jgi:hypothetical protein
MKTDVRGLDIDNLVILRPKEVIVYPDQERKPPIGEELNKPAIITLYNCWPRNKETGKILKDPEKLKLFEEKLKQTTKKKIGGRFISYNPENGEWCFRVEHFSRYGLDSEDEEIDDEDDDDENREGKYSGLSLKRKIQTTKNSIKLVLIKYLYVCFFQADNMEDEGEVETEDEASGSESGGDSESLEDGDGDDDDEEEESGDDGEESVVSEESSDFVVDQDVPGKCSTHSKSSHIKEGFDIVSLIVLEDDMQDVEEDINKSTPSSKRSFQKYDIYKNEVNTKTLLRTHTHTHTQIRIITPVPTHFPVRVSTKRRSKKGDHSSGKAKPLKHIKVQVSNK